MQPNLVKKAVIGEQYEYDEEVWSLVEVPTGTTMAIKNNRTGKTIDIYQAITELLNRTEA